MLVHYNAVLNFIVLFGIVILYRISIEKDKKSKSVYTAVLIVSAAVSAGLMLYFLTAPDSSLLLTREEYIQTLYRRGADYYWYYDYAFYNSYVEIDTGVLRHVVPPETFEIASPVVRALSIVAERIKFNFIFYFENPVRYFRITMLAVLTLAGPVIFYYKHIGRLFRQSKGNALKRFCAVLMMVQFPFTLTGCLFSSDITRWVTHAFIIAFAMFFYVLYNERERFFDKMQELKQSIPAHIWLLAYWATAFAPYA